MKLTFNKENDNGNEENCVQEEIETLSIEKTQEVTTLFKSALSAKSTLEYHEKLKQYDKVAWS